MAAPWFTAAELAGLPGMPSSEFRTRAKLDKLGVPSRLRQGRAGGGGREFDSATLPAETRAALLLQALAPQSPAGAATEQVPTSEGAPLAVAQPTGTALADPAALQRTPPSRADAACADARAVLLRRWADLVPLCGGVTRAAEQLLGQINAGIAAPELMDAARAANRRVRGSASQAHGVSLSSRTLFGWHAAHERGGWQALLPEPKTAPAPVTELPADVAAVLRRYASTSGAARNLTHVADAVGLELGLGYRERRALYDRARRALPKLDKVGLIKARHTGSDRQALLPYKRRLKGDLRPLDVGVCDGHSFKAKVRHPDHGHPFTPEVTVVMDVATRCITGWSVSFSESTIAVGDAMRHSVAQHGVYALMYTDNGAGQKAKRFDCPVTGLFERLGTEHRTGRPRSPQGRGVIERSWKTHMIKCARQFATYSGSDADEGKYRDTALALAREQTAIKRAAADGQVIPLSAKCPSWQQFLDAVAVAVREYNDTHRHRELPRHDSGPLQGLRMTPMEALQAMLVPGDVQHLDAPTLRALFMPSTTAVAQRGWVRTLGQHYYSGALMQHDGERLRVDHDIHDGSRVWVWTLQGDYVCEALFEGNSDAFFARSVVDLAREKRTRAAIKRRQAQIDLAQRELQPTLPAPADAGVFIGDLVQPQGDLQMVERVPEPEAAPSVPAPDARPFFDSAADRYEWLMRHRSACTAAEAAWLAAYADGPEYESLRDYFASRGLEWPRGDDAAFNQAG